MVDAPVGANNDPEIVDTCAICNCCPCCPLMSAAFQSVFKEVVHEARPELLRKEQVFKKMQEEN